MKILIFRTITCCTFLFFFLFVAAQNEDNTLDDISINSLSAPASPGSIILGVNPADIQKPTDLTGLMVSLRNATDNFTQLPVSFAIDIAPAWLFSNKKISYADFISNRKAFLQTLTFSYAQLSQKDENYNGLKQGIGFSFSLIRPAIKVSGYLQKVSSINQHLKTLLDANDSLLTIKKENNIVYQQVDAQINDYQNKLIAIQSKTNPSIEDTVAAISIENQILVAIALKDELDNKLLDATKKETDEMHQLEIESLQKLSENITPVRKGFFLNIAGGTLAKYDDFKAGNVGLTNTALWLTTGWDGNSKDYTGKSTFSVYMLSRFIYNNADEWYKSGNTKSYNTFDNGLRIAYTSSNQKILISAEATSRKLFKTNSSSSFVYKYLLNAQWAIGFNQVLTFSYGRDFNNHITKDGNVIGYLNFVQGLFTKKTLKE